MRGALLFIAIALAGSTSIPIARADDDAPASSAHARSTVILGRFTTTFAYDAEHRTRAFNVDLAAGAIDGQAIAPGATLSFNDRVGERTAAFGFEKGTVIRDHMMAEGTGGGTCQVASTLHAAALLAGLTIASRAPHTRPSGYIRAGLDATVAFPRIDLKIRNSRSDRVVIHARAFRGTLDVWFEGVGDRSDVTVTSEIVETTPFVKTFMRDASIPADEVRVRARGIPGYRVRLVREIRAADGSITREVHVDTYAPTPELLVVAPSFDVTRLEKHPRATDDAEPRAPFVHDEPGVAHPTGSQLWPAHDFAIDNCDGHCGTRTDKTDAFVRP